MKRQTMNLSCPACRRAIKINQPRLYDAGFSNLGFLYCDTCPTVLEFSSYNPKYVEIVGDKHPWMLTSEEKAEIEAHLVPCPHGGQFRFDAFPRCPNCGAILASLKPDEIHFVELGNVIDGDQDESVWLS